MEEFYVPDNLMNELSQYGFKNKPTLFVELYRHFLKNNNIHCYVKDEESKHDGSMFFIPVLDGYELNDTGSVYDANVYIVKQLLKLLYIWNLKA